MCGFWEPRRNAYHHGQDCGYDEGKGSVWPPQVVDDATASIDGLENMLSRLTSQRGVSNHEPPMALRPHDADYKLNVMLAWCQYAAPGKDATCAIACTCPSEERL